MRGAGAISVVPASAGISSPPPLSAELLSDLPSSGQAAVAAVATSTEEETALERVNRPLGVVADTVAVCVWCVCVLCVCVCVRAGVCVCVCVCV